MVAEPIRAMQIRHALFQFITLGIVIAAALMLWKGFVVMTGSESPLVVVLSESMEPGFKRGDILFLHMSKDPIRTGEIVVFNDGRGIPIVHRVIELWLQQHHIMGRAIGYVPYAGWVTIAMTEKPFIKYLLIGAQGLLVIAP
uniref:Signal peptidase complex catalytic subunit SEC11 n=1 Tax=Leersia perrieri TaxID=77586 RepID=A0A0D9VMZ2_9ORYZ